MNLVWHEESRKKKEKRKGTEPRCALMPDLGEEEEEREVIRLLSKLYQMTSKERGEGRKARPHRSGTRASFSSVGTKKKKGKICDAFRNIRMRPAVASYFEKYKRGGGKRGHLDALEPGIRSSLTIEEKKRKKGRDSRWTGVGSVVFFLCSSRVKGEEREKRRRKGKEAKTPRSTKSLSNVGLVQGKGRKREKGRSSTGRFNHFITEPPAWTNCRQDGRFG